MTCEVEYQTGRVIASIGGELDVASASELERHLQSLLMLPLEAMDLDLSGLTFMDSAGLSALVRVSRAASELRVELSVLHASTQVERMLGLTSAGSS